MTLILTWMTTNRKMLLTMKMIWIKHSCAHIKFSLSLFVFDLLLWICFSCFFCHYSCLSLRETFFLFCLFCFVLLVFVLNYCQIISNHNATIAQQFHWRIALFLDPMKDNNVCNCLNNNILWLCISILSIISYFGHYINWIINLQNQFTWQINSIINPAFHNQIAWELYPFQDGNLHFHHIIRIRIWILYC